MGHDDDPPIRFRPEIRLFRQDGLAPPEPLIREVQDEFAVRPDLPPVPPVVEAQEAIAAMFELGRAEFQCMKELGPENQRQFRRWTLRCHDRSCSLAEVYQRRPDDPRLIVAKGNIRRGGQWIPMPPLGFPAEHAGMEIALRLRCRCTREPIITTPSEIIAASIGTSGQVARVEE